jgi:hypothetical protein
MCAPRYHQQPVLLLIYRTIHNLEHIDRDKSHEGPFEVTQRVNSFLAIVAHPWDQLLDKHKLETEVSPDYSWALWERRRRLCAARG